METVTSSRPSAEPRVGTVLAGLRVLIVEDEAIPAMALHRTLRDSGADVVGVAQNMTNARRFLREFGIDAAVLDIGLRGVEVYPFADELKEMGIPFVFLSGRYLGGPSTRFYTGVPDIPKSRPHAMTEVVGHLRGWTSHTGRSLH